MQKKINKLFLQFSLKIQVERSKHFVTEKNLDEQLEAALENPMVYDYAVDLDGNKYCNPVPKKYVKGTPTRQKGRMYDETLGTKNYTGAELEWELRGL